MQSELKFDAINPKIRALNEKRGSNFKVSRIDKTLKMQKKGMKSVCLAEPL
jgi:hypothetical protein